MDFKRIVALAVFVALTFSNVAVAAAGEKEGIAPPTYSVVSERPAVLPLLYASLGALQVLDIYSTRSALNAGAREANVAAAPFAGSTGSMIGLKAVTTASTIFFAERLWKKNKVGAIVMLAAINGATAAVSMHNMRNAKLAASR